MQDPSLRAEMESDKGLETSLYNILCFDGAAKSNHKWSWDIEFEEIADARSKCS